MAFLQFTHAASSPTLCPQITNVVGHCCSVLSISVQAKIPAIVEPLNIEFSGAAESVLQPQFYWTEAVVTKRASGDCCSDSSG